MGPIGYLHSLFLCLNITTFKSTSGKPTLEIDNNIITLYSKKYFNQKMLSIFIPRPNVWEILSSRQTKTSDIWLGSIESIIALAYKRFRPGAKLKICNFRITNDHSHNFKVFRYNLELQSVKRTFCGGKAVDMYNMKHPIYFSEPILSLLPEEDRKFLLGLAIQGLDNMLSETYSKDEIAKECLHQIKLILQILNDYPPDKALQNSVTPSTVTTTTSANSATSATCSASTTASTTMLSATAPAGAPAAAPEPKVGAKLSEYKPMLRITNNYMNNPLTVYNHKIWSNSIFELKRICGYLRLASQHTALGKEPEEYLSEIKKIVEPINDKMFDYYQKIIEGK